MKIVPNIKLKLDEEESLALNRAIKASGLLPSAVKQAKISKLSVDARSKANIHFVCTVRIDEKSDPERVREYRRVVSPVRPAVIGFGPAGMFCALTLARHGLRPIVFERGSRVDVRREKTESYWSGGALDPECNVQFGEGGAGAFSDGKLTTLIGDPLCESVLEDLAEFGAPREILWTAKPHIGTDRLPGVVAKLREQVLALGGEILFDTKVTDFEAADGKLRGLTAGGVKYEFPAAVLAVGHSARDVYQKLFDLGAAVRPKAFSVGVRIEHLAEQINKSQYGELWNHPKLGAADYKLAYHDDKGNHAYTFCMCPGGTVVASSSEADGIVTNGMSAFARDGINSNSALLVGVDAFETPEAGIEFQRNLEKRAYLLANEGRTSFAPCQRVGDFLAGTPTKRFGEVIPSYAPAVVPCDLSNLFDERIGGMLKSALPALDRKLRGFASPDAVLTAPETRSSAPLTVLRGEDFQSLNVKGLFPCGEGCGYAGGIMSAAVDGIKTAYALIKLLESGV